MNRLYTDLAILIEIARNRGVWMYKHIYVGHRTRVRHAATVSSNQFRYDIIHCVVFYQFVPC